MFRRYLIAFLPVLAVVAHSVASGATLDQSYDPGANAGGYFLNSASPFAQTFTAGITGQVTQVNVRAFNYFGAATAPLQLDLYSIGGPYPEALQTNLASGSISQALVPSTSGFVSFDLTAANASLVAGQQYAIVISTTSGFSYEWEGSASGTYAGGSGRTPSGGNLYYTLAGQNFDFGFQTFVNPVPEPTTVALLGTGLIGLLITARHRRKAA